MPQFPCRLTVVIKNAIRRINESVNILLRIVLGVVSSQLILTVIHLWELQEEGWVNGGYRYVL